MEENVDRLDQIWSLQINLQKRLGRPNLNIDFGRQLTEVETSVVERRVQEQALCLVMEASELMDWTRWKHWSSRLGNKQDFNPGSPEHIQEMRVEVIDLLHFLINAADALGMGPNELYQEYLAKHQINHARQDTRKY